MYIATGEYYGNDYTRKNFEMRFGSLNEIFEFMKKISKNFNSNWSNYFPTPNGIPHGTDSKYDWVSRISCHNEEDRTFHSYWIHQIESENGIIFSDGKYTKNEKFCSKKVEEWLVECDKKQKASKPKFVEE